MNLFQRIALAKLSKTEAPKAGKPAPDSLNKLERSTLNKLEASAFDKRESQFDYMTGLPSEKARALRKSRPE